MTESELKRMLQDYNRTCERLWRYQERLKVIDALISTTKDLKAVTYTGMPGNPSNISDPTYQSVERILCIYKEEEDELKVRIHKLEEKKEWVDRMLAQLKEDDFAVVNMRLIQGHRWSQIMQEFRYRGKPISLRQLYRQERRALNVMLKVQ